MFSCYHFMLEVKNLRFIYNNILSYTTSDPYMLLADTFSTIGTAVGVSVTFMVAVSLGVLMVSVLCYISRRTSYRPSHDDPANVYEEVGNKKKSKDIIVLDTNTAYGIGSAPYRIFNNIDFK